MACREILKGLTSLTYHVEDLNALQDLKGSLTTLRSKFSTFQTTDEKENMALTTSASQAHSEDSSSRNNYLPLPVRPKKKRFARRFGAFASMMNKHYKVHFPVNEVTSKKANNKKRKMIPIMLIFNILLYQKSKEQMQGTSLLRTNLQKERKQHHPLSKKNRTQGKGLM